MRIRDEKLTSSLKEGSEPSWRKRERERRVESANALTLDVALGSISVLSSILDEEDRPTSELPHASWNWVGSESSRSFPVVESESGVVGSSSEIDDETSNDQTQDQGDLDKSEDELRLSEPSYLSKEAGSGVRNRAKRGVERRIETHSEEVDRCAEDEKQSDESGELGSSHLGPESNDEGGRDDLSGERDDSRVLSEREKGEE